jgi:hypothetical protein
MASFWEPPSRNGLGLSASRLRQPSKTAAMLWRGVCLERLDDANGLLLLLPMWQRRRQSHAASNRTLVNVVGQSVTRIGNCYIGNFVEMIGYGGRGATLLRLSLTCAILTLTGKC